MPAYVYTETDQKITAHPCKLFSVLIVTDAGGPGKVDIYDGDNIDANHRVATLRCDGNSAQHYRWSGLELSRGLYVEIVEKADYVTIEWEPVS